MSLTKYSEVYTPQYHNFIELTVKHEKVHWFEHEAKLGIDVTQWKNGKITDQEKELISNILRIFTQSDVNVGQAYYEKLIPVIKNNEARNMFGSFAAREATHQRAYALLSDTLGFGEDFYWQFLDYHETKEKHEFMIEPIGKSHHDFAVYRQGYVVEEEAVGGFVERADHRVEGRWLADGRGMRDGITQMRFAAICDEAASREERQAIFQDSDILGVIGVDNATDFIDGENVVWGHWPPLRRRKHDIGPDVKDGGRR